MSQLKSVVPWVKDDQPPKRLQLALMRDGHETDINIVDEAGVTGFWIATVGPKGLRRACGVSESLGFPLDENGRIKLDE